MPVRLEVSGGGDIAAFGARLQRSSNRAALRADLVRDLRRVAQPAAAAARAKVRSLPIVSDGGGLDGGGGSDGSAASLARGGGLRSTVASLVVVRTRTTRDPTVAIEVAANRMPDGQKALPRHLDSYSGWRHPVYGNRRVWVRQAGGPWFASSIEPFSPAFRAAVEATVDAHVRRLS